MDQTMLDRRNCNVIINLSTDGALIKYTSVICMDSIKF